MSRHYAIAEVIVFLHIFQRCYADYENSLAFWWAFHDIRLSSDDICHFLIFLSSSYYFSLHETLLRVYIYLLYALFAIVIGCLSFYFQISTGYFHWFYFSLLEIRNINVTLFLQGFHKTLYCHAEHMLFTRHIFSLIRRRHFQSPRHCFCLYIDKLSRHTRVEDTERRHYIYAEHIFFNIFQPFSSFSFHCYSHLESRMNNFTFLNILQTLAI